MSEPIRLSKDGETRTVYAPRYAAQLVSDGWRLQTDVVLPSLETQAGEPLTNYDAMTAREVVEALEDLDADERAAVLAYEQENQARVTILRALEE